jgi:hypothetical protein
LSEWNEIRARASCPPQDTIVDGGPHAAGSVCREALEAVRVEAADGVHQAKLTLGDEIRRRRAVELISRCNVQDELVVATRQSIGGGNVVSIAPAPA